jgi:hypothetical protein
VFVSAAMNAGGERHGPGLAETKHPEEDRPVRVQPISRRRTDLAGNDGAVERGQLVEAHERGKFQAGLGGRGDGSHVGAAALNRRDEADDEIGTAVIVARDHQSRAALVAREVGERKSSKNDAAEREHSARWLNQVGVGVEFRLFVKPVEPLSGLRNRGDREFTARSHLDQYMHPRMRRNAAAGEFGRDLASFSVEDDL